MIVSAWQKQVKEGLIREGVGYKRGQFLKGWEEKWVVLTKSYLLIFQDSSKQSLNECTELAGLKDYSSFLRKEDNIPTSSLKIDCENSYHLSFQSVEEKWSWMVTLERLMDFKAVGASHYNSLDAVQSRGFKGQHEYTLRSSQSGQEGLAQGKEEQYRKEIDKLRRVVDEQEKYFQKTLKEKYSKLNAIEARMLEKQKKYEELADRLASSRKQEESSRKAGRLQIIHLPPLRLAPLHPYQLLETFIGMTVAPSEEYNFPVKPQPIHYHPQLNALLLQNDQLRKQIKAIESRPLSNPELSLAQSKNQLLQGELEEAHARCQLLKNEVSRLKGERRKEGKARFELVETVIGRSLQAAEEECIAVVEPTLLLQANLDRLTSENQRLKSQVESLISQRQGQGQQQILSRLPAPGGLLASITTLQTEVAQLKSQLSRQKDVSLSQERTIARLRLPATRHTVKSYFKRDLVETMVGALPFDMQIELNTVVIPEDPRVKLQEKSTLSPAALQKSTEMVKISSLERSRQYQSLDQKTIRIGELQRQRAVLCEELQALSASRDELKIQMGSLQEAMQEQTLAYLEYRKMIKANAAKEQANRIQTEKELDTKLEEISQGRRHEKGEEKKQRQERSRGPATKRQGKAASDMKKIFQNKIKIA